MSSKTTKPEKEPTNSQMVTRSKSAASQKNSRKRPRKEHNDLEHPYTAKIDHKVTRLHEILNKIYDLANNDLVIVDRDSGINDYTFNEKFADKLESIGKHLIGLQKECDAKAAQIRERVQKLKDKKLDQADMCMIENNAKKGARQDPSVNEEYFIVKRRNYAAWVSSGSEDDEPEAGDMDTKFTYRKTNGNDTIYTCSACGHNSRNKVELRNHYSNHHKELYRCMKCSAICRSQRSFYNHSQTHTGVIYTCKTCGMQFRLKSSFTNHAQKHSEDRMKCDKCEKTFQYRQSYVEHITYRHTDEKSVPCPVCKKYYWTPSLMRSHRAKKHGLVTEMFRGVL